MRVVLGGTSGRRRGERFSIPLRLALPGIDAVPRVRLARLPSPVERVAPPGGPELWLKRDDLNADSVAGNKVRALEFLLGAVRPGETVLTIGGEGSTHVLATAAYATRLGARTVAVRWRHEMNRAAARVRDRARQLCDEVVTVRTPVGAMLRAQAIRLRRDVHWVPLGGSSPLGVLGHVNAALELAEQVRAGLLPSPARIVAPLGSGGTVAGLALGLELAGLDAVVVGARVGPRAVVNHARVRWLARRTAALIRRVTGVQVPAPGHDRVQVYHDAYGGAYGRPLAAGEAATAFFRLAAGVELDATYSAKAAAAALALAGDSPGPLLLWLTFDSRWIADA